MRCPSCGAAVKEGNFCNYCGAKLTEDPKRIEVKIDKRIEDVAELRRVEYEEQESRIRQRQAEETHENEMAESKLRQKMMKKQLRQSNGRFLKFLIWFCVLGGCATIIRQPTTGVIMFAIAIVLVTRLKH